MESNSVQSEGGDVVIKLRRSRQTFFSFTEKSFSTNHRIFELCLQTGGASLEVLGPSEEGAHLWMLYITTDSKDPEHATFALTTKVRFIPTKPEPDVA